MFAVESLALVIQESCQPVERVLALLRYDNIDPWYSAVFFSVDDHLFLFPIQTHRLLDSDFVSRVYQFVKATFYRVFFKLPLGAGNRAVRIDHLGHYLSLFCMIKIILLFCSSLVVACIVLHEMVRIQRHYGTPSDWIPLWPCQTRFETIPLSRLSLHQWSVWPRLQSLLHCLYWKSKEGLSEKNNGPSIVSVSLMIENSARSPNCVLMRPKLAVLFSIKVVSFVSVFRANCCSPLLYG